jgi:sulfur-oxidizing protein SoxY
MQQIERREFLQIGTALSLAFAAGVLKPAEVFGAESAAWDNKVFDAKTVSEAVWAMGGDVAVTSNQVLLSGPEMVGSGFVVPLSMESKIPNTDLMMVVVHKNPSPVTAAFRIPPDTDPMINTRIKMGETSTIYGIARAEGKYYVGSTMIKVRAGGGGCG